MSFAGVDLFTNFSRNSAEFQLKILQNQNRPKRNLASWTQPKNNQPERTGKRNSTERVVFVHVRGHFQFQIVELYDTVQVLYQVACTVETRVTRL